LQLRTLTSLSKTKDRYDQYLKLFTKVEDNVSVSKQKEYPLLTIEMLITLERRVDRMKTTPADLEFIDHYITSIGHPGHVQKRLREEDVYSFDEITEALIETDENDKYSDDIDLRPGSITGSLLGCIHSLMGRVRDCEKIC
jgi:hypothetical protein